ncbi:putative FAD-binding protein [Paratrimastix pyriformis]|uniref:FAD-binding protein n=1 Tax=Paratrimastix pyriformis TaxID=342808 RepID=A0ABQ8UIF5_9EUKA|nr:putative FAD-binding protein [Paratrimastix pyriformis]
MSNNKTAIVIGSGFGGLNTAGELALRGWRVTVLEKHSREGGMQSYFSRAGVDFDASFHFLYLPDRPTPTNIVGRLVKHLMPISNMMTWRAEDFSFESGPNLGSLVSGLIARFPDQEAAIRAYTADLDKIANHSMEVKTILVEKGMQAALGAMQSDPEAQAMGQLSAQQLLDKHFPGGIDPRLLMVLMGFRRFLGEQPGELSLVSWAILWKSLEHGAWMCRPGSGVKQLLAEYLKLITEAGGQVRLNSEVKRILVEATPQGVEVARGVELADGTQLRADVVVSACALPILGAMVPGGMPKLFAPKPAPEGAAPAQAPAPRGPMRLSPACDALYVALRNTPRTAELLAPFRSRSIWFNSAADLAQAQTHLDALNAELGAEGRDPEEVLDRHPMGLFATLTAPPPGTDRAYVLSCSFHHPVSPANFQLSPAAYAAWKQRRLAGMLAGLERCLGSLHPGGAFGRGFLHEMTLCAELATDRTLHRYTGSPLGCIYGPANIPAQSIFSRPPVTAIPGLWLAGQWALGGPGMTGCMVGAGMIAAEIDRAAAAPAPVAAN